MPCYRGILAAIPIAIAVLGRLASGRVVAQQIQCPQPSPPPPPPSEPAPPPPPNEVSLGSGETVCGSNVVEFRYDVSGIQFSKATLVVNGSTSDDPYARYVYIGPVPVGNDFWRSPPPERWVFDIVSVSFSYSVTITDFLKSNPSGSIYVAVSNCAGRWTITAKIVFG